MKMGELEQHVQDREKSVYVVGNLYITDIVWEYVRKTRPLAIRAGLLKREIKKYVNIMEVQMNQFGIQGGRCTAEAIWTDLPTPSMRCRRRSGGDTCR